MPIEEQTLPQRGTIKELDDEPIEGADEFDLSGGIPPIYGRCPICSKPLFPRDRFTGEMKAPPVGKGYESRAKCDGCGAILYYAGNGKWKLLLDQDLSDDDRRKDQGE